MPGIYLPIIDGIANMRIWFVWNALTLPKGETYSADIYTVPMGKILLFSYYAVFVSHTQPFHFELSLQPPNETTQLPFISTLYGSTELPMPGSVNAFFPSGSVFHQEIFSSSENITAKYFYTGAIFDYGG